MKNKFKTIGILGGIGPSASASMYMRIIEYMQKNYGAWDDADFPKVMVYSTSLSGFNEYGIADKELVAADLVQAVKKLEDMGSELIIVACNTVHYFDKQMEAAVTVPLVHMISEACSEVKKAGYTKVGIACSQSTKDLGLYRDGLTAIGVEPLVTTDEEQRIINGAIKDVMSGQQDSHTKSELNKVFKRFKASGAEAILLGCTELPLAISEDDTDSKLVDANHVVIKQAIELAKL